MKRLSLLVLVASALTLLSSCATVHRKFQFPPAEGAYAVGSTAIEIVDRGRADPYAKDQGALRDIMIQLWYPAERAAAVGKEPLPYGPEIAEVLKSLGGAMGASFSYLSSVPTATYAGLAPAEGPFPVLLYSPGNLSTRFQNMAQVAHLVSRGYVVIGVDHPYTSGVVRYPDGRSLRVSDRREGVFDPRQGATASDELEVRVDDMRAALAWASKSCADASSPYAGLFDFSRIGAFGHSLGGATVLQLAAEDPRIKAVFSEEGGVWGSVAGTGIAVPLLYMQASKTISSASYSSSGIKSSESSKAAFAAFKKDFATSLTSVFAKTQADRYYLNVQGFNHFSFSDAPLYSDYFAGPVDYRESLAAVNDYLDAFFGRYLRGEQGQLLDGPSAAHREVSYTKNAAPPFPPELLGD